MFLDFCDFNKIKTFSSYLKCNKKNDFRNFNLKLLTNLNIEGKSFSKFYFVS